MTGFARVVAMAGLGVTTLLMLGSGLCALGGVISGAPGFLLVGAGFAVAFFYASRALYRRISTVALPDHPDDRPR